MKYIDDLFKESETDKEVSVRPELWRKLERRLDEDEIALRPKKPWRPWMIAASFIFLISISVVWKSSNQYSVEDLQQDQLPAFTKDQLFVLDYANYPPKDYSG